MRRRLRSTRRDTVTENAAAVKVAEYDDAPPPRVATTLKRAPRVRDLYWCRLPKDAELPEFWKERPAVVISRNAALNGVVMVVPCTSRDQKGSPWAVKLAHTIDGKDSWAVCDKPMSVAVSRLRSQHSSPRVTEDDFTRILARVLQVVPTQITSDAKRARLVELLRSRHGKHLVEGADPGKILDDLLGWMINIKD